MPILVTVLPRVCSFDCFSLGHDSDMASEIHANWGHIAQQLAVTPHDRQGKRMHAAAGNNPRRFSVKDARRVLRNRRLAFLSC